MESFETEAGQNKSSVTRDDSKKGGWITFPFIIGNLAGLSVAAGGWGANWIVFLITKFNVGSIAATKISNVGFGFINLFPVAGAVIADSFTGNFLVVAVSSFVALIGMIMLTLASTIKSMTPSSCSSQASSCERATMLQSLFLYAAMGLSTVGFGGSRFAVATMGAEQFDQKPGHQALFFNWFFVVLYIGSAVGIVAIVYVDDNVGWAVGFGVSALSVMLGLVVFVLGKPYYRLVKPHGSPFSSIARVVAASLRNRNTPLPDIVVASDFNSHISGATLPSKSFRFLNRAAIKHGIGDERRPWTACTVQEVEDLKQVVKILPLWSSGILVSVTIGMLMSFTIVQALTMDRRMGSLTISAGTFGVFSLVATALSIFAIDSCLLPAWQRLRGHPMTPLQKIGVGHVVNAVAMVVSALVEVKRRREAALSTPVSAFWLIAGLAIVGLGEGFHFPGQVSLYYQEFPKSLKSSSTAMISLLIALGFYLSAAFTGFIDQTTGWLPDDINRGRLDKVFWLCAIIAATNFGYFSICSSLYKYHQNDQRDDDDHL